jgi:hypothetical protein
MNIVTQTQIDAIIAQGVIDHGGEDYWNLNNPRGIQTPCSPHLHRLRCGHFHPTFPTAGLACNPELCVFGGALDVGVWPVVGLLTLRNAPCLICKIHEDTAWIFQKIQTNLHLMELDKITINHPGGIWPHIEQSRVRAVDYMAGTDEMRAIYYPLWQLVQLIARAEGSQAKFVERVQLHGVLHLIDTYRRHEMVNPPAGKLSALAGPFPAPIYANELDPLDVGASELEQTKYKGTLHRLALRDLVLFGSYRPDFQTGLSAKRLRYCLQGMADADSFGVMRAAFILTGLPIVDLPATIPNDPNGITLEWVDARMPADEKMFGVV